MKAVLKGLVCGLAALAAGPAQAQDSQLEAARRCTGIKDSLERLVCYDRALAPTASAVPVAPAQQTAAPARPVAEPTPPVQVAAPPPAKASVPVGAAVPAFGAEQLEQQARKERESAVREVDARVAAVTQLSRGMVRISLDNGQVWDQVESSTRFDIKVGDTLRIKKGAMGSYRMARVSNGTSGWVGAQRRE